MTKTFVHDGKHMTYTAPAAVSSGDVVQVGQIAGIAIDDAANGAQVVLAMEGVHRAGPKNATQAWTEGQLLYWTGTEINTTGAGNLLIGSAASAELAAAVTGEVRLNGNARADGV